MDMLNSIVDNIHSPEKIYSKIGDLAGMHYRLGVTGTHMPILQQLLMKTFAKVGGSLFTAEVEAAWGHVWDYMTVAMTQVGGLAVGDLGFGVWRFRV